MSIALVNGQVLTSDGWRDDLAVRVEGKHITELLVPADAQSKGTEIHDLAGRYLLPGFIDCQVNGGGGVLFNDQPNVNGIRAIAAAHRRLGTTGLLPTLISDSTKVMREAIHAVDAAIEQQVSGVLGIHIEGPYLAPARKGVHNVNSLHAPNATEIELATSLRHGRTLMTLAPERVTLETLHALTKAGVMVAAGHTAGDYAAIRRALDNGVRGFTHLFNAMTPLASREPGAVGAALEDRASWCGVIVDGRHVHPATLRVALAAKPRGKVFLVSDAMPPVGNSEQSFMLNGETITVRNGACETAAGVLAGSILSMRDAVRNCVQLLGLPLDEAVRMASTYPADFLGLEQSHGRIAVGYRADFTVMDKNFAVHETWIGGRYGPASPT
ncbi:MAG TPA: N-acetylglucosamine-6-phosphate deacetylase [Gammaproteobacteria bacterium]|nr:N-acetylglucosamine-6-phosphate deacetylase [Gammaproteobacteria bacterium]